MRSQIPSLLPAETAPQWQSAAKPSECLAVEAERWPCAVFPETSVQLFRRASLGNQTKPPEAALQWCKQWGVPVAEWWVTASVILLQQLQVAATVSVRESTGRKSIHLAIQYTYVSMCTCVYICTCQYTCIHTHMPEEITVAFSSVHVEDTFHVLAMDGGRCHTSSERSCLHGVTLPSTCWPLCRTPQPCC